MDKKEDKLEGFFKKKLENYSVAEDGWNRPPEFLWKEAKIQFPNRKKKRKKRFGFFILLGSFIVMALFLLKLNTPNNINNNYNSNEHIKSSDTSLMETIVQEPVAEIDRNDHLIQMEMNQVQELEIANDTNEKAIGQDLIQSIKKNEDLSQVAIIESDKDHSKLVKRNKLNKQEKTILPSDRSVSSNAILKINELTKKDEESDEIVSNNKFNGKTIEDGNTIDLNDELTVNEEQINVNPELIENSNEPSKMINRSQEPLIILPKLEIENSSEEQIDKIDVGSIFPFIAFKKYDFWAWEFGVSHKVFTDNPLSAKDDIPEIDFLDLDIDVGYSNVNFKVEKNLAHNLSFSSGLDFSIQEMDLSLKFKTEYEESLQEEDFRNDINQLTSAVAEINEDAPGDEAGFRLISNVVINEGDPIEIEANLSALMNAIEIPLMMHYNWRMSKWEIYAGAGIHLSALHVKLNPLLINVYHEGQKINVEEYSVDKTEIEYSWDMMGAVGLKYIINSSFNVGLSFKSQMFTTDLQRIELGLYYRI